MDSIEARMSGPEVTLDKLPRHSPWPARLLGLLPWTTPQRDIEKVGREYNDDKYARCLAHFRASPGRDPEDIKRFEFGVPMSEAICVSAGTSLRLTPVGEVKSAYQDLLRETLQKWVVEDTVFVELGCGYGYNLWMLSQAFPDTTFLGGEYSHNAVDLADQLFVEQPGITVDPVNFYDTRYPVLDHLPPDRRAVVFTSHAVEQLPSARQFIDTLSAYRGYIRAVVHFEPLYEAHDDALLGLMRRRYAEINDYNRDLLSVLQSRADIHVVGLEADVLGLNPLNATSVLHWEFVAL